ncbi:P-II family nitrogen regulator [Agathobaculum sp. TL06]
MSEYQPQMTIHSAVELVVAVVDTAQAESVLRVYRENHALVSFECMARGTARTEMLDLLGLGETSKAIVMCLAGHQLAQHLLERLGYELKMRYPGRGIAFSVPVTGIGVRWHKLLTQAEQTEVLEMDRVEKKDGFDVVAVVMEQGYTNLVMDVARKAGARGGTVISARGIAEDEVKQFFGIEIQAEKEIVFLVVKGEEKQEIMTAIMKAVGMKTKSHGIVLSLPVSNAIGLAD